MGFCVLYPKVQLEPKKKKARITCPRPADHSFASYRSDTHSHDIVTGSKTLGSPISDTLTDAPHAHPSLMTVIYAKSHRGQLDGDGSAPVSASDNKASEVASGAYPILVIGTPNGRGAGIAAAIASSTPPPL